MKSKLRHLKGFTLIELLVVIAIIGLLASIVVTSLTSARARGRDTRRISDLEALNTAIQIYIIDNGNAPYLGDTYNCQASNVAAGSANCGNISVLQPDQWAELGSALSPYLSKLPTDPCGANCNTDDLYALYIYRPPAAISAYCFNISCPIPTDELNSSYSILAGLMEVGSPTYVNTFGGSTTFGFKNHSVGESF